MSVFLWLPILIALSARFSRAEQRADASCAFLDAPRSLNYVLPAPGKPLIVHASDSTWAYYMTPCGALEPSSIPPQCAALGPAPIFQLAGEQCFRLGAGAAALGALPANAETAQEGDLGFSLQFEGGDKCDETTRRRAHADFFCSSLKESPVGYEKGAACSYGFRFSGPEWCPPECPRGGGSANPNIICSGRGACVAAPRGGAVCKCDEGFEGASCGDKAVEGARSSGMDAQLSSSSIAAHIPSGRSLLFGIAFAATAAATAFWRPPAALSILLLALASFYAGVLVATPGDTMHLALHSPVHVPAPAMLAPFTQPAGRFSSIARNAALLREGTWSFLDGGATWLLRVAESELLLPPALDAVEPRNDAPIDILLIGDSVDRFVVDEGCGQWGIAASSFNWAEGVLFYSDSSPARKCDAPWGSISSLHLFGAPPQGPYYWNFSNNARDPFVDTELRIPKGLALYEKKFGKQPDVVVYQSGLWDSLRLGGRRDAGPVVPNPASILLTPERNILHLRRFRSQAAANIDLIRSLLRSERTVMLLRTTPVSPGTVLLAEFNAALRGLGDEKGLGVVDLDAMLRAELFNGPWRDNVHPTTRLCIAFHAIIVGFARQCVLGNFSR